MQSTATRGPHKSTTNRKKQIHQEVQFRSCSFLTWPSSPSRRTISMEVMGLTPDVEPLPHQAFGPWQLQEEPNQYGIFKAHRSKLVLQGIVEAWAPCPSCWCCCCHLSLFGAEQRSAHAARRAKRAMAPLCTLELRVQEVAGQARWGYGRKRLEQEEAETGRALLVFLCTKIAIWWKGEGRGVGERREGCKTCFEQWENSREEDSRVRPAGCCCWTGNLEWLGSEVKGGRQKQLSQMAVLMLLLVSPTSRSSRPTGICRYIVRKVWERERWHSPALSHLLLLEINRLNTWISKTYTPNNHSRKNTVWCGKLVAG
jgi:hypothetical protein